MSKRFILTQLATPENETVAQNVFVLSLTEDQARKVLERQAKVNAEKAVDDRLYAFEYWDGHGGYYNDDALADVVRDHHEEGHEHAERVAGLIREFLGRGQNVLCVDDPDGCLASAIDDYEGGDDTRLDCRTVVVTDDSFVWQALIKHGDGAVQARTLYPDHLKWLAGETVQLDADELEAAPAT